MGWGEGGREEEGGREGGGNQDSVQSMPRRAKASKSKRDRLVDGDVGAAGLDQAVVLGASAADGAALAVVVNGEVNTNDVDGDVLALDTDHAGEVVQAEESSGLLGLSTVVLKEGRKEGRRR